MTNYQVVEVRATGRTPEAVAGELREILSQKSADGWEMDYVQPIIYNSSTTGYLLLFFSQRTGWFASLTRGRKRDRPSPPLSV